MADIRQELKDYQAEHKLSDADVARAIGSSPTTVNLWKHNKYTGDNSRIEKGVKAFLENRTEKDELEEQTATTKLTFIETSVSKKIFEVAKVCHLEHEMGVAYGIAGLGKTSAVKEYARINPATILIEADLGYSAKVLFQEIARQLSIEPSGSLHSIFEACVSKLKNSDRLIIVDEAEHLPFKALELIRRVYDKAEVGVLLCGMPRLVSNLRGKKGEYAQLYSRVGISACLDALKQQDTEALVRSIIPDANGICKVFHEECCGNTRVLSKLLARSIRVAGLNNIPLNADVIRETSKMLIV